MKRSSQVFFSQEELQTYALKEYSFFRGSSRIINDFHQLTDFFKNINTDYPQPLSFSQLIADFKQKTNENFDDTQKYFKKNEDLIKRIDIGHLPQYDSTDNQINYCESLNRWEEIRYQTEKIQENLKENEKIDSNNQTFIYNGDSEAYPEINFERESENINKWENFEVEILAQILEEIKPRHIKKPKIKILFSKIFDEFQKKCSEIKKTCTKSENDIRTKIARDIKKLCENTQKKCLKIQECYQITQFI